MLRILRTVRNRIREYLSPGGKWPGGEEPYIYFFAASMTSIQITIRMPSFDVRLSVFLAIVLAWLAFAGFFGALLGIAVIWLYRVAKQSLCRLLRRELSDR